ncbi:LOW QUALITY PROTEIN: kinesin-like protein KIN-7J [Curcuma longa]|uniref:LOW QUALITY PROTEIN: kinesin-like protein KIN-7J n=1 Tax=Curcuma longa TaxID=136217 RepID=UPI003D9F4545
MSGITAYCVEDIYDYIQKHEERQFFLKFSAMEIYNESVRDLLSADSTPLRLLDDPERGTVVEKLTEEPLANEFHLRELLETCAAQRQIGETALNETSSRSHQILRLTIESRDSSSTLSAAVNFVDLAGSERASQVSSASNRLKEGCHINRSLLTLGTVIRKLSKGRGGHVPFRDSKLTRILQPFLGGSGRTAIVCTMSPARSHVEQSRNTLLFASCAREVATNARVNVVVSDKALVRRLQRELARLETDLMNAGLETRVHHSDALKDRDAQIEKMEREIKELMAQRDLAQSRLDDLLHAVVDEQSRHWEESSMHSDCEDGQNPNAHQSIIEEDCKEVRCVEVHALSKGLNTENESLLPLNDVNSSANNSENLIELEVEAPEKNVMNIKAFAVTRSRSCKPSLMSNSICSFLEDVEQDNKEFSLTPEQVEESKANLQDQEAQRTELETDGEGEKCSMESLSRPWPLEFERKQQELIQLWHSCHVSLAHRSCFFLLFKGDPADSFYMEVECRRLSFLKNKFSHSQGNTVGDGHTFCPSSSMRHLRRERERLCKQMERALSPEERESLYVDWGISLNSKQRKMQLSQLVWTRLDVEHVRQSSSLVAKIIGFAEQGEASKEMFGLSFTPQPTHRRSFTWIQG